VPNATVDGANIYYEIAGKGDPLILLHGIGSSSYSWRRQIQSLSLDFTVVAWDAPGYGGSSDPPPEINPSMRFYADRLRGLIDLLGLDRIFLLGHSSGGVAAQEFYRAFPERVRALILSDTRFVGTREALDERLTAIQTMGPVRLAIERGPRLLTRNASRDLVREVISIMSQIRRPGYEFAAIALAESDTREVIRNLGVPTLLIWGSEDEITPLWTEVPAGAALKIIPNAGHLCYIEQPEQFNNIVADFLLSHSGR
jgi:pimeloyl-ACP methyl ester carboxylesterase